MFLVFCFPDPKNPTASGLSWKEKWKQFDTVKNFSILGSVICLLLALQWGGSQYRWDSWRITLLLVSFAVLGFTFIGNSDLEKGYGNSAPLHLQKTSHSGICMVLVYERRVILHSGVLRKQRLIQDST